MHEQQHASHVYFVRICHIFALFGSSVVQIRNETQRLFYLLLQLEACFFAQLCRTALDHAWTSRHRQLLLRDRVFRLQPSAGHQVDACRALGWALPLRAERRAILVEDRRGLWHTLARGLVVDDREPVEGIVEECAAWPSRQPTPPSPGGRRHRTQASPHRQVHLAEPRNRGERPPSGKVQGRFREGSGK